MDNIIMAITNITCLLPLKISLENNDYLTFFVVLFVSTASLFSHLVENHKHGMPGIGFSKLSSYILNRFDVFGAFLSLSRFAYIYYYCYCKQAELNLILGVALIIYVCNLASEYDKYNPLLKNRYMVLHSIWHLGIYIVMNWFLETVYLCNCV